MTFKERAMVSPTIDLDKIKFRIFNDSRVRSGILSDFGVAL